MKKFNTTLETPFGNITVEIDTYNDATAGEIKSLAIEKITSMLKESTLEKAEFVAEFPITLWAVYKDGELWTNLLESEQECVEHINDSILEFPEYFEDDFSYRVMSQEEVEKSGTRL